MPRTNLTDARVTALKPRKTAYDIRDKKLGAFGVRVLPSGRKRFFVHCQHRGQRVWKILGDAGTVSVTESRSRAAETLAAIRRGEPVPPRPDETLFESVAETVFERYERLWKPRTLIVNRSYLRKQILPHFTGWQVADIDPRDVRNWFVSLHSTPAATDRSMPVLSVIMKEAGAGGFPHARPFQHSHDATLRPSRGSRGRGSGRARRAGHCSHHRPGDRLNRR